MGIVGMTLTLAKEGPGMNFSKDIKLNCVAPNAMTNMTEGIIPPDVAENVTVKEITPVLVYLAHESCSSNGNIYECGGGWVS